MRTPQAEPGLTKTKSLKFLTRISDVNGCVLHLLHVKSVLETGPIRSRSCYCKALIDVGGFS